MLPKLWCDALNELRNDIKNEFNSLDLENISVLQQALNNTETRLKVWKLLLFDSLNKANDSSLRDECLPILSWIFENETILEQLLCSGGVPTSRWNYVINILCDILNFDPKIIELSDHEKGNNWKQRLAVATALTFSSPVISVANKNAEIDALKRYHTFSTLAENVTHTPLFLAFYNLSPWHLRYVVGSWAEDDELEWARAHVPRTFANSSKIGESTHEMVPYREYNDEGTSVHEGASYYKNKPLTLQVMHEVGGVCGTVSRFGAAMAQAHGIPAMPIAQPGHCAFLWWKEGKWALSNDVSGITRSTVHDGIQLPWDTEDGCYVILMNEAQKIFSRYKESESMRIISGLMEDIFKSMILLKHSLSTCSVNFLAWKDFACKLGYCEMNSSIPLSILSKLFLQDYGKIECIEVLSSHKPVRVSDCEVRAQNLVDGTGSEWWTENENAWIEIDLQDICKIEQVEIQWWGLSVSRSLTISSSTGQEYQHVRSSRDDKNNPQDYNEWSYFEGWSEPTNLLKFELNDGKLDPWGMGKYFGIRQILVKGQKIGSSSHITNVKTVETSENWEGAQKLIEDGHGHWKTRNPKFYLKISLTAPSFIQYVDLYGHNIPINGRLAVLGSLDGESFYNVSKTIQNSGEFIRISCLSAVNYLKLKMINEHDTDVHDIDEISFFRVSLNGWNLEIKDILHLMLKKELSEYPQIQEKIERIYEESSFEVLSDGKPVTVSDCEERGANIVDGTDSEWWTETENAYVEIDMISSCFIKDVRIRWWGTSISKNVVISVSENGGNYYTDVKTSGDAVESPTDMNGWSRFLGWDIPTRKVKFNLRNGSLDPWGMNKYFGIRQIVIRGRKLGL